MICMTELMISSLEADEAFMARLSTPRGSNSVAQSVRHLGRLRGGGALLPPARTASALAAVARGRLAQTLVRQGAPYRRYGPQISKLCGGCGTGSSQARL